MAPSPISELVLIPARIIEAILYLILAIYVKKRGKQGDSASQLNDVLFVAFLGGFLYSAVDNIVYLFGGLSFDPNIVLNKEGYEIAYPSLFLANIFRDIGMAGMLLNIWCLFIASIEIKYGVAWAEKKILKNKIVMAIIVGISALIIGFDLISISISSQGTFIRVVHSGLSGIIMLLALTLYFIAAILFRRASIGAFPSDAEKKAFPLLFQRTKRFSTGLLVMGFGYFNAIAWGQLATIPEILVFALNNLILLNYITHGLWILALIIMFSALGRSLEKVEK